MRVRACQPPPFGIFCRRLIFAASDNGFISLGKSRSGFQRPILLVSTRLESHLATRQVLSAARRYFIAALGVQFMSSVIGAVALSSSVSIRKRQSGATA